MRSDYGYPIPVVIRFGCETSSKATLGYASAGDIANAIVDMLLSVQVDEKARDDFVGMVWYVYEKVDRLCKLTEVHFYCVVAKHFQALYDELMHAKNREVERQ